MSIERVRQFNQIAENDSQIQKDLEATTDSKSLLGLIVKIGTERGFKFTAQDLDQYYLEESTNTSRGSANDRRFLAAYREMSTEESNPRPEESDPCERLPYLVREICRNSVKEKYHGSSRSSTTDCEKS
ncbi:Nif11-like leader peptide family natural product precursor [Pannus brasiliensis]|uniref:Nif11-like leader peptide family natural product precursor n=1 Tax=Pannus brasiliensis TaxID=1579216 RepID=UPI003BEF2874